MPNSAVPTQYQLASVTLTAGTVISVGSIDLPVSAWMIHGVVPFSPGFGVAVLGAAISGQTNTIDDYSQYTQVVANTNPQMITVPMKYYCGAAKTFYLVGLSGGGSSTTNTSITVNSSAQNMYAILRAVRVA